VRFRLATPVDVPSIVALIESAYRGEQSRAGWTTEADLLGGQRTDAEQIGLLVAGPDSRLLLAERTGRLVGTVLVVDEGDAVYLGMFAVRPDAQAGGVGSALLAEGERFGKSELARSVARMTVLAQRPELIAWYERRGYERTGERRPFPYGDLRVGIPLRDDLVFEVLEKHL
jgi:ribosomal protein S18 acetylase RimI-like enzyme